MILAFRIICVYYNIDRECIRFECGLSIVDVLCDYRSSTIVSDVNNALVGIAVHSTRIHMNRHSLIRLYLGAVFLKSDVYRFDSLYFAINSRLDSIHDFIRTYVSHGHRGSLRKCAFRCRNGYRNTACFSGEVLRRISLLFRSFFLHESFRILSLHNICRHLFSHICRLSNISCRLCRLRGLFSRRFRCRFRRGHRLGFLLLWSFRCRSRLGLLLLRAGLCLSLRRRLSLGKCDPAHRHVGYYQCRREDECQEAI